MKLQLVVIATRAENAFSLSVSHWLLLWYFFCYASKGSQLPAPAGPSRLGAPCSDACLVQVVARQLLLPRALPEPRYSFEILMSTHTLPPRTAAPRPLSLER